MATAGESAGLRRMDKIGGGESIFGHLTPRGQKIFWSFAPKICSVQPGFTRLQKLYHHLTIGMLFKLFTHRNSFVLMMSKMSIFFLSTQELRPKLDMVS